ncbi:MAG: diadenylate cyclase CdaA [bacterium]|nr:diadenylate cyclase CdaA [bacterium]
MIESAGIGIQLAELRERGQLYLDSLSLTEHPFAIVDIAIVALIFYWAYRFFKGTRAATIMWGIILVAIVFVAGRILQLDALNWLLRVSIPALLVAIPVVFQPELRRALERLGRGQPWRGRFVSSRRQAATLANELYQAIVTLAKTKTGALLVIARRTGLEEHLDTGQQIDAGVSTALLLNIFFPNSPLHDGAVIIRGGRIVSAGVTLPLADAIETYQLGTRHKAALGITEASDALAIVVSEERGTISIAFNGTLAPDVSLSRLLEVLQTALRSDAARDIKEVLGQPTQDHNDA